jgi:hypothetical protein
LTSAPKDLDNCPKRIYILFLKNIYILFAKEKETHKKACNAVIYAIKIFIIRNKNLSEVRDKYDKQDISEISYQIQKKFKIVLKKFVEFDLKLSLSY